MSEFERLVLADLATLKSEMRTLLGNGQPGRLRKLEEKVDRHESALQRAMGIAAFVGAGLTIVHLGIDFLRFRH